MSTHGDVQQPTTVHVNNVDDLFNCELGSETSRDFEDGD